MKAIGWIMTLVGFFAMGGEGLTDKGDLILIGGLAVFAIGMTILDKSYNKNSYERNQNTTR